MKIRIVADSSANLFELPGADFVPVAMKIITGEKEYVDDPTLDVPQMLEELENYHGKSGTACPGIGDWLEAFGDADVIFGIALTSKLSGCYNAAYQAANEYMKKHPYRQVFILDSLTTGPEMELILEKYKQLIDEGLCFEQIRDHIQDYLTQTHLMFSLESLQNFVNNGRVNRAVAAAVKVLGICVMGQASSIGELQVLHKCRGNKRAVKQILISMQETGYQGGKVRIRHSYNQDSAEMLAALIKQSYPNADIQVGLNQGLCCFYAEKGGLLVGFESTH